jgi:hypothetical protein
MKQSLTALIILSGVLLMINFSQADSSHLYAYYDSYMTEKITNCQRIATISNCQNSPLADLVKMRALQAEFYNTYRTELVENMVASDVGKKPYKIDYFLIKQFKNGQQTVSKY